MSRASWRAATAIQRRQARAYASIVARIPVSDGATRRPRGSRTPGLDRLASAAESPGDRRVAAAVFEIAMGMVGREYAAVAADELIRLAPEVHARRLSVLDVRNIAIARAARAERAERPTDLVDDAHGEVLESRPRLVPASPMLSPELTENITSYAEAVYGRPLTAPTRRTIDVGLACVFDLIETYNGKATGPGAVLVSMQAQQSGRDSRHLPSLFSEMGMSEQVAIALTRILAGCGRDPQTSILWHALRDAPLNSISELTMARLRRDISDLDQEQFADDLDRAQLRRQLTRETHRKWQATGQHSTETERTALGK